MTVWFTNFCKGCMAAFSDGMGLYGRSGLRF